MLVKVIRPTASKLNQTQIDFARGQSRFNPLPLEVITAYWLTQVDEGNKKALSLVWVEDEARA
jgi:hypothetical protein